MLVRIEAEDVEIGMFIHAFEGSWFDHPFWRSYFRVETHEQLSRIRSSGIDGLVIDAARKLGASIMIRGLRRLLVQHDGADAHARFERHHALCSSFFQIARQCLQQLHLLKVDYRNLQYP